MHDAPFYMQNAPVFRVDGGELEVITGQWVTCRFRRLKLTRGTELQSRGRPMRSVTLRFATQSSPTRNDSISTDFNFTFAAEKRPIATAPIASAPMANPPTAPAPTAAAIIAALRMLSDFGPGDSRLRDIDSSSALIVFIRLSSCEELPFGASIGDAAQSVPSLPAPAHSPGASCFLGPLSRPPVRDSSLRSTDSVSC